MNISVEELASLLNMVRGENQSPRKNKPSKYHTTWGEIFKEVAPRYGNPSMRHKEFGALSSRVHYLTKERLKDE